MPGSGVFPSGTRIPCRKTHETRRPPHPSSLVKEQIPCDVLSPHSSRSSRSPRPLAVGISGASSPTVVGSRMLIGAGDGKLYCLDLLTGKRLWQARTGGRVRATPAVQNGIVVVGSWTGGCTPNL
ncbi:MAG: PQQ-binding-like beta-propeller repeat protein [Gemmatimonadales bacterium]